MSAQDWTVTAVREGKVEPNPHGGSLQKFFVDFQGADGETEEGVYWRRKEGNAPEVGQVFNGEISDPKGYGAMFKQSKGSFGGGGSSGNKEYTSKKKDWTPEADRDPERSARILRQHSQGLAVQVMIAQGAFRDVTDSAYAVENEAALKAWTDYFDADVHQAGKAALQGAGGPSGGVNPSASPPPPSPPAPGKQPVDLQEIETALDNAGLTDPKSRAAVATYMVGNLPDDRLTKAVNNIAQHEDLERQTKTLDALVEATEKQLGGPLPSEAKPDPDDDIPF